jgi:hypothetical protein
VIKIVSSIIIRKKLNIILEVPIFETSREWGKNRTVDKRVVFENFVFMTRTILWRGSISFRMYIATSKVRNNG